jgi:hypothetical protein
MDTEFEELVADSMRRRAAAVCIPAGLTGMVQRARRRQRQRQFAIRGVVGATAAVGTAAAAVALTAGPRPAQPGPLKAETAAYVLRRTEKALAGPAARTIQYDRETSHREKPGPRAAFPPGGVAIWYYGELTRMEPYAANGKAINAQVLRIGRRTFTETTVNFGPKTWWRITGPVKYSYIKMPARKCGSPFNMTSPPAIRQALSCGLYVLAGRQHVDGIDAIKLAPGPLITHQHVLPGYNVIWVSPATYLPVRIRDYHAEGSRSWFQEDFRWLPPTRVNLAAFHLSVTGFRKVTGPGGTVGVGTVSG